MEGVHLVPANGSYFDSETSSNFPLIEFKIGSLLFLN